MFTGGRYMYVVSKLIINAQELFLLIVQAVPLCYGLDNQGIGA
jgi:hypothetical protein